MSWINQALILWDEVMSSSGNWHTVNLVFNPKTSQARLKHTADGCLCHRQKCQCVKSETGWFPCSMKRGGWNSHTGFRRVRPSCGLDQEQTGETSVDCHWLLRETAHLISLYQLTELLSNTIWKPLSVFAWCHKRQSDVLLIWSQDGVNNRLGDCFSTREALFHKTVLWSPACWRTTMIFLSGCKPRYEGISQLIPGSLFPLHLWAVFRA